MSHRPRPAWSTPHGLGFRLYLAWPRDTFMPGVWLHIGPGSHTDWNLYQWRLVPYPTALGAFLRRLAYRLAGAHICAARGRHAWRIIACPWRLAAFAGLEPLGLYRCPCGAELESATPPPARNQAEALDLRGIAR